MLISQRIRDYLVSLSLTDTQAASPTYYVGIEQPEPDFAVTILPEQGTAPTRTFGEQPQFTVIVRHAEGDEANLFLRQVFQQLQEFQGRLGSSPVLPVARVTANITPVQLGRDAHEGQGRWRVSQTYTAILRQVF
jgi:hypothetical protein